MHGKAWLVLTLTLAAAGCFEAAARAGLDVPATAAPASAPAVRLGLGENAMEPHVAMRDAGGSKVIVVANMADVREGLGRNPTTRIEVHRSLDGGASWTSAPLPSSVFAAHDPLGRVSFSGDAVLAYGPGGELYLAGVAATGTIETLPLLGPCCLIGDLSVFVTRSDDDGATWSPAKLWVPGVGPTVAGVLQDKEWLTVGPDGVVHFAWTTFTSLFHTTIHYARSTDGGDSWSTPIVLRATDVRDYDVYSGTTLAAPGDGRVYASYSVIEGNSNAVPGEQVVLVSDDNGLTWSAPVAVGASRFPGFGLVFADPADPDHAFLTVPDGDQRAYLVETTDGGATWSAPLRLSSRAGPEPLAAGWVDDEGRAVVAYYDQAWPGGERVVVATVDAGAVVGERVLGSAVNPGIYRREYLGVAGAAGEAWAAWVGGDEATGTWIEAQRATP